MLRRLKINEDSEDKNTSERFLISVSHVKDMRVLNKKAIIEQTQNHCALDPRTMSIASRYNSYKGDIDGISMPQSINFTRCNKTHVLFSTPYSACLNLKGLCGAPLRNEQSLSLTEKEE